MTNWDDAVIEAKKELGYGPDEYVPDWDAVMYRAKRIFSGNTTVDSGPDHTKRDERLIARYLSGIDLRKELPTKK